MKTWGTIAMRAHDIHKKLPGIYSSVFHLVYFVLIIMFPVIICLWRFGENISRPGFSLCLLLISILQGPIVDDRVSDSRCKYRLLVLESSPRSTSCFQLLLQFLTPFLSGASCTAMVVNRGRVVSCYYRSCARYVKIKSHPSVSHLIDCSNTHDDDVVTLLILLVHFHEIQPVVTNWKFVDIQFASGWWSGRWAGVLVHEVVHFTNAFVRAFINSSISSVISDFFIIHSVIVCGASVWRTHLHCNSHLFYQSIPCRFELDLHARAHPAYSCYTL